MTEYQCGCITWHGYMDGGTIRCFKHNMGCLTTIGASIALFGLVTYGIIEVATSNLRKQLAETKTIVGTVLEEVRHKNRYALRLQTNDGRILGVAITDGSTKTAISLDALIENGTKISFPDNNVERGSLLGGLVCIKEETNFTAETKFGQKRADRITILKE